MVRKSQRLFTEPSRMPGFFVLLDWLIENRPEKAIINYRAPDEFHSEKMYVDSAYVAFRLSEILDVGGFPISRFENLEEFIVWNRIYHLIENGQIGRHSRIFDEDNPINVSELKMILQVVQLKYPETTFLFERLKSSNQAVSSVLLTGGVAAFLVFILLEVSLFVGNYLL